KSRPTSAVGGIQTPKLPTKTGRRGQALLGAPAPLLVLLEKDSDEAGQRWLTFLRNHREAIAGIDFFSVPTVTFNVLYVFFIIRHDRRRILRLNVTRHPTSAWIVQQLREAFLTNLCSAKTSL